MEDLEKVINELKELGYTEEKLSELFALALDDIHHQMLLDLAGEALVESVNVDVTVKGGGFMAQAMAIRGAIAKALVEFSKDKKLKEKMLKYDRMLLVDDARFKEAKKPLGLGARRKKQSSKR